jgi:hypothetical protein
MTTVSDLARAQAIDPAAISVTLLAFTLAESPGKSGTREA